MQKMIVTEERLLELLREAEMDSDWSKWWSFRLELAEMRARKDLERLLAKAKSEGNEKVYKGIERQLKRLDRRAARRLHRLGISKNALFQQ